MTRPLRQREFRLLFLGRVVDELGDSVAPAALTLAVVQATGSAGALAVVLAATLLPRLALLPLGGVAADRLGARRVALAADGARCLTQLSIAVELISGHVRLVPIAVVGAVSGAASAFGLPATSPLVAGTVDEDARQAANSLMGVAASATRLAGPAAGVGDRLPCRCTARRTRPRHPPDPGRQPRSRQLRGAPCAVRRRGPA